jgi:hypothetical protein
MRLNEIADRSTGLKAEQIISLIRSECSDILAAYKATKKFLYRGSDSMEHQFCKFSSRDNRTPLDNGFDFQKAVDSALRSVGATALRSNSTFVTSQMSSAEYFGRLFVVFPINGFQYTWVDRNDLLYYDEDLPENFEYSTDEEKVAFLKPNVNTGIEDAIRLGREIMIRGSFYAIHYSISPGRDLNIYDLQKWF